MHICTSPGVREAQTRTDVILPEFESGPNAHYSTFMTFLGSRLGLRPDTVSSRTMKYSISGYHIAEDEIGNMHEANVKQSFHLLKEHKEYVPFCGYQEVLCPEEGNLY